MSPGERKIGHHHLAFYRGWLQGLDLKVLADRYLETGLDLRLAKTTLHWLRDTLSQAALRHDQRGEARLLRLHLAEFPAQSLPRPSLDDFRAAHDPGGFYGEQELIQLYLDAFPEAKDKRCRQRQRLIDRQLAALVRIERLLAIDPVPADPVSAWFDEPIADRLLEAGIPTVGALVNRIGERGYRWWATVPKLGEKGAARIVAWLQGYASSVGALPRHSLVPARSQSAPELLHSRRRETSIVPLEVLVIPEALSGRSGLNRHPCPPRVPVTDDLQATQSWLTTKSGNPNTERAYRKEAERLLLWAIIERGEALSDLAGGDCLAYRDWLSALGRTSVERWPFRVAQTDWIGKRNTPRFSPAWRPFDGPLSAASIRQALAVVSCLFDWLVRVQYCAFNPWDAEDKQRGRQGRERPRGSVDSKVVHAD